MKNIGDLFSSKVRAIVIIAAALILALLIFHAGVVVGSHRRSFDRDDMDRGFRSSFFPGNFSLPHGFISNSHGAVGTITAVTPTTLTLQTREGASKTVAISTSTEIRWQDGADTEKLSVGNEIIVLGVMDAEGRIGAKLIHVLSAATSTP